MFPGDVFTLFNQRAAALPPLENATITQSFLGYLPFVEKYYRNLFPLYPAAIQSFDLSEYDLIISSSHCMAKNIVKAKHQIHICYCHTPLRYIWDLHDQYSTCLPFYKRAVFNKIRKKMQCFDQAKANDVDLFIANSHFVKNRIARLYNKDAIVVYPPVQTDFFRPGVGKKKNFFLTCSRFVPYKKVDLIVKAFKQMPEKQLIVVGEGPEEEKLKRFAASNITFLKTVKDDELKTLFQQAEGFVYAAVEDFGIILAESISCGCPVIAYGEGGAQEIVKEDCGILYPEQSTNSLIHAMQLFEEKKHTFQAAIMHDSAERFNAARFNKEIKEGVDTYIRSCGGKWSSSLAPF